MAKNAQHVSLSAFARSIGVSPQAVSKAFLNGRLSRSVTRNRRGLPVVTDLACAREEWEAGVARGLAKIGTPRPTPIASGATSETYRCADEEIEIGIPLHSGLVTFVFARGGFEIVYWLDAATAAAVASDLQLAAETAAADRTEGDSNDQQ